MTFVTELLKWHDSNNGCGGEIGKSLSIALSGTWYQGDTSRHRKYAVGGTLNRCTPIVLDTWSDTLY